IVLDGDSKDETAELVRAAGGSVIAQGDAKVDYASWRQRLLGEARKRGATHTIWLDADEAFTTPFLSSFHARLRSMRPGQKLILDWLCLWKDPRRVRADGSVW